MLFAGGEQRVAVTGLQPTTCGRVGRRELALFRGTTVFSTVPGWVLLHLTIVDGVVMSFQSSSGARAPRRGRCFRKHHYEKAEAAILGDDTDDLSMCP